MCTSIPVQCSAPLRWYPHPPFSDKPAYKIIANMGECKSHMRGMIAPIAIVSASSYDHGCHRVLLKSRHQRIVN